MNIYKLHDKPEDLHRHKDTDTHVAKVFWDRYVGDKEELAKREDAIAKDPTAACKYAMMFVRKPWPKGEDAIAKDATTAFKYASFVLKAPWPKGEAAIAKDPFHSTAYAMHILKGRFKKGEATIAKTAYESYEYARAIGEPFIAGEPAIANSGYAKGYVDKFPERKEAIVKLIKERDAK